MQAPPKDELLDACERWGWDGAAEEYEVDEAQIRTWLREADLTEEDGLEVGPGRPNTRSTKAELDEAQERTREMRREGWLFAAELGEQIGEAPTAISYACYGGRRTALHGWSVERSAEPHLRDRDRACTFRHMYRLTSSEPAVPYDPAATLPWKVRAMRGEGWALASEVAARLKGRPGYMRVVTAERRGQTVELEDGRLADVERSERKVRPYRRHGRKVYLYRLVRVGTREEHRYQRVMAGLPVGKEESCSR